MKKVLIVSPHFPPINAPDMQRVRLALPHLRAHGWEPVVLAVAPESVEGGVREPLLEETYPADVRVVRVRGISPRLTRWAGVGSLWWRTAGALARAGARLLAAEKFDLVFFSTTQFGAFGLGPTWRAEFGVPYVLDYQDPWRNDFYRRTGTRPPGGALKYWLSQRSARRTEPRALREAAGVIAVSESYGPMLAENYPWFDASRVELLPFGAAAADLAVAAQHRPAAPLIDFGDGLEHHVYTGRGGDDMAFALTAVLRGLRHYRASHPAEAARLRLHFVGTGYAPPPLGRDWAVPVAAAEGVADQVREHRYRVPYFEALHYLCGAHALMAVGSDDARYSASKIYPYVLARRPLLLVFHRGSLVLDFARRAGAGERVEFEAATKADDCAAEVHRRWFVERGCERVPRLDAAALAPFTAEALTARLAAVFERAAARRG